MSPRVWTDQPERAARINWPWIISAWICTLAVLIAAADCVATEWFLR